MPRLFPLFPAAALDRQRVRGRRCHHDIPAPATDYAAVVTAFANGDVKTSGSATRVTVDARCPSFRGVWWGAPAPEARGSA